MAKIRKTIDLKDLPLELANIFKEGAIVLKIDVRLKNEGTKYTFNINLQDKIEEEESEI